MKRAEIDEQNDCILKRQHHFRMAADVPAEAFGDFDEVEAVAVIGSVAVTLWKEIPRFREFRRAGIEVWHECKDLDLAVWISSLDRLGELRRARDLALRDAYARGTGVSVVGHEVDVFLIEPGSDRYFGRLCNFNACPKGKRDCLAPGCGDVPFNRQIEGFPQRPDMSDGAGQAMIFRHGQGRIRSAVDLPAVASDGGK